MVTQTFAYPVAIGFIGLTNTVLWILASRFVFASLLNWMNAQISDTFFLSKSVGTTLASEKNLFHIKIETNIMQKNILFFLNYHNWVSLIWYPIK